MYVKLHRSIDQKLEALQFLAIVQKRRQNISCVVASLPVRHFSVSSHGIPIN